MKKADTGKPKRRAEFSLVRAKTASKKEKEKVGKENQSRDVLQIIRTKEERLSSAFNRDDRSVLSSITNNRLTHKLGLYGKAKHSDTIHREGKTAEHTQQLQQDGSSSSEAYEEEGNMECSPTFVNDQDMQCTAEHIALVLLPENTFGTVDYLYQLRCHLQRLMKQNEAECSDEQEDDDKQQTITNMEDEVIAVTISHSVPVTNVITTTHHNLSLPTHHHCLQHSNKDMPSESDDISGWIPYCSHDPIQLVTARSPTPTHSLPFGVGLELTVPPAPPSTAKSDILDLLDSIPNVTNPLGVSPSPPKLLPHRLY